LAIGGISGFAKGRHGPKKAPAIAAASAGASTPVLWADPQDISSRSLFYGPGGMDDQPPQGRYTFVEEDLGGTNPKIVVKDQNGVKWTVKLGAEAKPEIAATRLTWGIGYFATEDYFLHDLKVDGLPAHLHRGQRMVAADGTMHGVRLKRHLPDEKKIANWEWKENAFSGTRELNGLRVLMAVINNWDLTDENTGIFLEKGNDGLGPESAEQIYMVSDVGSTFGSGRLSWPLRIGRGDLRAYRHSKFITKMTPEYVDFFVPTRPAWLYLATPPEFISKLHLRWIGRRVPRGDAKWLGQQLGRLSPDQIRDAFRAAGYSPAEVEGFADAIQVRISALQEL
jgi:hypothetical protein